MNMADCKTIEEVRENIDRIDREIVELISQRSRYVEQAAKFKKTTQDVKAPARVEEVILKVRGFASENHLDPDIIEKIYRAMIACFIDYELKAHKR
ncbi:MAG TPA: chorismate mutase [candidate division Zixibacteria bacterium]|nr:chorismate mutase [candidate division Zixibacteria bacterium]